MDTEQQNHRSLLEIYITHMTVPMFTNPQRFVDPLHAIELYDEQRNTPCHENETKKQRAKRETRCDLHNTIQRSLDLGILSWRRRGMLSWRMYCFRDMVVFLRGQKNDLLVILDLYRRNTSL